VRDPSGTLSYNQAKTIGQSLGGVAVYAPKAPEKSSHQVLLGQMGVTKGAASQVIDAMIAEGVCRFGPPTTSEQQLQARRIFERITGITLTAKQNPRRRGAKKNPRYANWTSGPEYSYEQFYRTNPSKSVEHAIRTSRRSELATYVPHAEREASRWRDEDPGHADEWAWRHSVASDELSRRPAPKSRKSKGKK